MIARPQPLPAACHTCQLDYARYMREFLAHVRAYTTEEQYTAILEAAAGPAPTRPLPPPPRGWSRN